MRVTVSSHPSSDQQPQRHHLEIGRPDHVLHAPYSPGETEAFARYVNGGEPGNVAIARGDGVRSAKGVVGVANAARSAARSSLVNAAGPRWCAAMSCGLVLLRLDLTAHVGEHALIVAVRKLCCGFHLGAIEVERCGYPGLLAKRVQFLVAVGIWRYDLAANNARLIALHFLCRRSLQSGLHHHDHMSECAAAGPGNGARLRHCAPCVLWAREPQRLIVSHEALCCRKSLTVAHSDNLADSAKACFKALDFAGTCDAAVR